MAAAVSQVLINNYVYGPGDTLRGIQANIGIPCAMAIYSPLASDDPKIANGVNTRISYRLDPVTQFFTNESAASLVAQSNGNVSAS